MQGDEETDLRNNDESKDFFVAEAAAGRLEGDASAFCGRPFLSFGDMWDVLAPDIDDRIARYLQLAKLCGNFRAAGSGASACYPDYPECGALVGVRMAAVDNGENAELETVYPVFVGYPARADIVARYDWDNGLCGFVSVSVPEGPSLDFFVPSYGMSRGLCVPGSRVGIAQKLTITAERDGADFPVGIMPIGKTPQFFAETDGKIGNPHSRQAGNQKMPEFVHKNQNPQQNNERDNVINAVN